MNQKQPQIKYLDIVADATCLNLENENACDLQGPETLRCIRWVAGDEDSLGALGDILKENSSTLEEIEIDQVGYGDSPRTLWVENPLLHHFLELNPEQCREELFPSLKNLKLCAVCLRNGYVGIASVFSLSRLHALVLRNCLGANLLLKYLSSSHVLCPTMQLKNFEMNENDMTAESSTVGPLVDFLKSFDGLECLFLSYPGIFSENLANSIANHRLTLKSLVCHRPQINCLRSSMRPSSWNQPRFLLKKLREMPYLICLGLNCPLKDLVST